MKDQARKGRFAGIWQPVLALACLLAVTGIVVACSSGGSVTGSGMATVNVRLSDPATCKTPEGMFSNVWVTITDVQANVSSSAGPTDSSWVDLTPKLASTPMQVDLLALAGNQCVLKSLGDNLELQAGSYQQIRLILADNTASMPSSNPCNSAGTANCVVTSNGTFPLLLSSEDKTGIKIPSGQIAGGAFTIAAGQTKDLAIDFNTCASIVQEGNGGFRLKPVLHAGEVSTTDVSINGTVLDASTGKPFAGTAYVTVEQPDANGIYRPVQGSQQVAADGTFVYCPLPEGTYDVVVVGSLNGVLYAPTVITGVATGSTTGNINLNPPATTVAAVSAANLTGLVSTAGSSAAISEVVTLSALETVNGKTYTIPLQPATTPNFDQTANVTTAPSANPPACAGGTDCADYTLPVSSSGAFYAAWSASGPGTLTPTSTTTALASYYVDGQANCSNTPQSSGVAIQLALPGPFNTTAGVAMTSNINLTGCQ